MCGVEICNIPAQEVPPQETLLAAMRDVTVARLGLPADELRVQFVSVLQALKGTRYAAHRLANGGADPVGEKAAALDFAGGITLARLLENGSWRVVNPSGSIVRGWMTLAAIWVLCTILFAIPCAYVVFRQLSQPIWYFAKAVERLGRHPRELRGVALSFNEMKRRLGRYLDDRLNLMSAIGHDLCIPLTRLVFRLECTPEWICSRAAADIAEVQQMLGACCRSYRRRMLRAQGSRRSCAPFFPPSPMTWSRPAGGQPGGGAGRHPAGRSHRASQPLHQPDSNAFTHGGARATQPAGWCRSGGDRG